MTEEYDWFAGNLTAMGGLDMEIQTVGRRRLVVRAEDGRIKIDILWKDQRLATLDLEPDQAQQLIEQLTVSIYAARP